MRKIVVLTVVLVATLLMSCTTTTGNDGGGLLKWAFDWAYDIAKKYAEDDDNWGYWDSDTDLAFFDCVLADEKCMLGRPRENSLWEVFFQNDNDDMYSVEVNEDGDEDGNDWGNSDTDFDEVSAFSNSKLEEMMAFCLDEDNDYWSQWDESPDDFWWFVEVSSDYGDWFSGVDEIFRVWFFDSQGDIDNWNYWGYIIIDCDGHDNDYDILDYYLLDEGPRVVGNGCDVPLSLVLSR